MKNQKLIITLLVAILAILLIPYVLFGTVIASNSAASRKAMREIAEQNEAQESTGDPELDLVLSMMPSARSMATYHMFGFNVSWTFNPDTREAVFPAVRSDYSGHFVENAQSSPDAYIMDWNNTIDRAITAQRAIQGYFDKSNADDVTVVVNVVDYDNRDVVYLSVANGIVGYDAVNGIDLKGEG